MVIANRHRAFLATLLISSNLRAESYHLRFGPGVELPPSLVQSHSPLRQERGFVTSDQPFSVSLRINEGNYRVTVTLGDPAGESITTVKAELRRLMLEHVITKPGSFAKQSFVVNVRQAVIAGSQESVHMKPRETGTEAVAWDDKLTIQFSDNAPKLRALDIEPVYLPTIFIAGDSTSADQAREPYNSWGQMITRFFQPEVAIANHAESGESSRSFITERRLAKLASLMRPGDTLLIQFGHNDQKETGENAGPAAFKHRLKEFIDTARSRGATPVLITPVQRRTFDQNGKIMNSLSDYAEAVRSLATEQKVALIDLNAMSARLYEAFGPWNSGVLFAPEDGTHHSDFGSYEIAKCVLAGLLRTHVSAAKFIVPEFHGFEPAHPDDPAELDLPKDPDWTAAKPYGN